MFIFEPLTDHAFTLFVGCLTFLPRNNNYALVCSSADNLLQVEPTPNVDRLAIIGRMGLPDILRKEHVKNLTHIKTFFIRYGVNDIEDEAFHGLKSLKMLYVGNCNVPVIKATYFDNPTLERFTFEESNVTDIEPEAFSKLPSAKEVAITKNKIHIIRKGVFTNTTIKKLYLGYNQIEVIEEGAFFGMTNLTVLELNENLLTTFNSELIIGESISLVRFTLEANNLTEITNSMTRTLPNLISLNLMRNSVRKIQCCVFKHLERLEYLYLSNNQIEELDPSLFDEKNNLTDLAMKRNNFSCISEQLLKKLSHLKYVEAAENPWEPSCKESARTYFSQHEIEDDCENLMWNLKRNCPSHDCFQQKSEMEKVAKDYCS